MYAALVAKMKSSLEICQTVKVTCIQLGRQADLSYVVFAEAKSFQQ